MKTELLQEDIMDLIGAAEMEGHTGLYSDMVTVLVNFEEPDVTMEEVEEALEDLDNRDVLVAYHDRYSLPSTFGEEKKLSDILGDIAYQNNVVGALPYATSMSVCLTEAQAAALPMAANTHITLILGDSHTGKSTTLSVLARAFADAGNDVILSAATGSGLANLAQHGTLAPTALSGHFLNSPLKYAQMVLVDEAELLTISQALELLQTVPAGCHIVLAGNPSVAFHQGAGDVLNDLHALDFPSITLKPAYHTLVCANGLTTNLNQFAKVANADDFTWDDSFTLQEPTENATVEDMIFDDTMFDYYDEKDIKIITETLETMKNLNNRLTKTTAACRYVPGTQFRHGSPIIARHGHETNGIYRGSLGNIYGLNEDTVLLQFPKHNFVTYDKNNFHTSCFQLAYATTLAQVKAMKFDKVFVHLDPESPIQTHPWLRATLAAANSAITLYGTKESLNEILRRNPFPPLTRLVEFTKDRIQYRHDEALFNEIMNCNEEGNPVESAS